MFEEQFVHIMRESKRICKPRGQQPYRPRAYAPRAKRPYAPRAKRPYAPRAKRAYKPRDPAIYEKRELRKAIKYHLDRWDINSNDEPYDTDFVLSEISEWTVDEE